jgi:hypothetical protein
LIDEIQNCMLHNTISYNMVFRTYERLFNITSDAMSPAKKKRGKLPAKFPAKKRRGAGKRTWLVVRLDFHYSVFSTYNFSIY